MVTETKPSAPYAPVQNVLGVVRRLRERGLPQRLTPAELEAIGIPAGNAPRTLAALKFLRLIDDEGQRTKIFEILGSATTDEYPDVLADLLRNTYEPVFTIVDPSRDGEIALHDAFRQFEPKAQRARMVTLFLGLCREAGIVEGGPLERKRRTRRKPAGKTSTTQVPDLAPDRAQDEHVPAADLGGPDYRLLSAVMQQLPKDGKWTQTRRDTWLQAVAANVDLLIEVVSEENPG